MRKLLWEYIVETIP